MKFNRPLLISAVALLALPVLLPARAQSMGRPGANPEMGRQEEDALRAQRRLELRHAIESQRGGVSQASKDGLGAPSLSPEQKAQLREQLRRQYGASADGRVEPRPPGGPRP
ncbi:hypothetical protein ACO2Q9_08400 [Variovorax sp. VNK109]|uniref:hypothetical protein n=1 Tax=Variovorax sp. VNK109 TaxID=3400919 RepID=UPI003C086D4B